MRLNLPRKPKRKWPPTQADLRLGKSWGDRAREAGKQRDEQSKDKR